MENVGLSLLSFFLSAGSSRTKGVDRMPRGTGGACSSHGSPSLAIRRNRSFQLIPSEVAGVLVQAVDRLSERFAGIIYFN